MKKFKIFILILIVLFGGFSFANAQTVLPGFSLPTNGTTWVMGSSQTINWKQSAEAGGITTASATLWLCGPVRGPELTNPSDIAAISGSSDCIIQDYSGWNSRGIIKHIIALGADDKGTITSNTGSYTWNVGAASPAVDGSVVIPGVYALKIYVNQNIYSVYPLNIVSSAGASIPTYPLLSASEKSLLEQQSFCQNGGSKYHMVDGKCVIVSSTPPASFCSSGYTYVTGGSCISTSTGTSSTASPVCDYARPPEGCNYVQGPNYNSTTSCGMVLKCSANSEVQGCSGGNIYNTQTGLLCVNNVGNTNQNPSVGSYDFGTATLKKGSKGDAVKELQRFLNDKLSLGLVLDGKLGPKTIAVIKKWQADHGLVADGLVGAKTKAQMNLEVN
ncbi:MAG: peptidoglycan-binding domain-containing protein [Candidatus Paceibacterota bacterium]|jgi:hypothetical protein